MGMADYKRFVSYIYNYEFNLKKNNIGYVRVESRNGQCKVTIHIKVLTMNEKVLPVYFFHREGERYECIWLGNIIPRKGMGDFQMMTASDSIMNTGYTLEDMGGMIIYASEEKFFGTEWDDKPIVLNEFEVVTERKRQAKIDQKSNIDPIPYTEEVLQNNNVDKMMDSYSVNVENQNNIVDKPKEDVEKVFLSVDNSVEEIKEELDNGLQVAQILDLHTMSLENAIKDEKESKLEVMEDVIDKTDNVDLETDIDSFKEEVSLENEAQVAEQTVLEMEAKQKVVEDQKAEYEHRKNVIQMKTVSKDEDRIMKMFIQYPKMYPFEDDEIIECVRIEPQDIGVFPMEVWALANNSFLLHGYYSYRHLIFAKQKLENGFQYVMGIPGVFQNRERFMAQMFGFHNFKSVKNKEQKTGEFGYWLTPIKCD